jgi:hypothetical protein
MSKEVCEIRVEVVAVLASELEQEPSPTVPGGAPSRA